jgi:hypothetical protein
MKSLEEWMDAADKVEQLLDETKNSLKATLFALEAELRDNSAYFSPTEKDAADALVA